MSKCWMAAGSMATTKSRWTEENGLKQSTLLQNAISMNIPLSLRVFWVRSVQPNLAIMPCPEGGAELESEIEALQSNGVDMLVSLLMPEEEPLLNVEAEATLCQQKGLRFISFPIPDFDIPTSFQEVNQLVDQLQDALLAGRKVVIHCRGGIGRSGMVAACLLIKQGISVSDSLAALRTARRCAVPATRAQADWIEKYSEWRSLST